MKIQRLSEYYLVIIVLFPHMNYAMELPKDQLSKLLQDARIYHQNIPPVAFDVECLSYFDNGGPALPEDPSEKIMINLRRKGKLIDIVASRYDRDVANGALALAYKSRYLWDGKRFFHWQQSYEKYASRHIDATISDLDNSRKNLLCDQDTGAFLEGRFWHNIDQDKGDWTELLRGQKQKNLGNDKELVGGYPCHVISAHTAHGDYKLWIDADHGYNVRHAVIALEGDDLAWGAPLSQWTGKRTSNRRYSRVEMEIDDVTIQEINGHFFPTEGTFVAKILYSDGTVRHRKQKVKRTNIKWNPDFDAMGAFVMDFPEGTLVSHRDYPIQYRWSNGKLVPFIDPYIVHLLDETSDQVLTEGYSDTKSAMAKTNLVTHSTQQEAYQEPTMQEKAKASGTVETAARQASRFISPQQLLLALACALIIVSVIWLVVVREKKGMKS